MDIKEFAKSIGGKEYSYLQFTKEEIETAKENGFVIVLRDKNFLEFRGTKYVFETEIPHETFMIYEGGKPYCRGIKE